MPIGGGEKLKRSLAVQVFYGSLLLVLGGIMAGDAHASVSVAVVDPDGGEVLIAGETYPVRWTSVKGPGEITGSVNIEYSTNAGSNWTAVSPPNAGNSGSYNWLVPTVWSHQSLVKITDANHPSVFDTSNELFTIAISAIGVDDDFDSSTPGWLVYRFNNIPAGLDASVNGDTVFVADGSYPGNLDFSAGLPVGQTRAITVQSVNGPHDCIIDCQGSGSGFNFHTNEGSDSIVDGFTITNGAGTYNGAVFDGGGIRCEYASPTIRNCVIINNEATTGAGISCSVQADPTIRDCTIAGNTASLSGGGIHCFDNARPQIINCNIAGNRAEIGGGINCEFTSRPSISNSIISGNQATYGGGLECMGHSPQATEVTLTNCIISGNKASIGGGLECYDGPKVTAVNSNITDNIAPEGSALSCDSSFSGSSDVEMINCILWGNWNGQDANCILNNDGSSIAVTYCDVQDPNANDADIYPGPNNIDDNPLFVMDGPDAITGTWTTDATYDSGTHRTIFLDSNANFVPGGLVGRWIAPDTYQLPQGLIVANTATAVQIVGNVVGPVSAGAQYRVVAYQLSFWSPCLDVGTDVGAAPTDIDSALRPIDVPGRGEDYTSKEYDMGPYERAALPGDVNKDSRTNVNDLTLMANQWLQIGINKSDIHPAVGDGIVNLQDFRLLAENWLEDAIGP